MKRNFGFILAGITALLLYGCFGSGGSSAPAPTNVAVVAKDSRVIVTWDMTPGVDYWIWKAAASGVTPDNCSSLPSCGIAVGVTSPASISVANGSTLALTNGTAYSFSINARTNGGPGGFGSPAVDATPRLSGATWNAGAPVSSASSAPNLRGVTYGNLFVAVGENGALFSSTDVSNSSTNGTIWTAATSIPAAATTTTLYAVSYDAFLTRYMVTGSGGMILQSTDAATWTQLTSSTTSDLRAIANNGGTTFVATGASGTITTSTNGGSAWAVQNSGTLNSLNGIVYGHGNNTTTPGNIFVAVGAAGTVLYSANGLSWSAATSVSTPSSDINGVTYGLINGVGTFVAVTADGNVITSTDGSTWTTVASGLSALNAVTASLNAAVPLSTTVTNAFVAVDNTGNIFRSTDGGVSWSPVGTSTNPLYAVTRGGLYDYSAVGAAGTNLYAD